jgi:hypothetical protein
MVMGVLGMIVALQRDDYLNERHCYRFQVMAGVCWALVMLKPQIGGLLLFPLVFGRKWGTIITAGTICFLASIPPAFLCGKSVVSLLLEVLEIGNPYAFGNGLVPAWLGGRDILGSAAMPACLLIGGGGCVWLSFMLRKESNWLIKFLPAILLFPAWVTYHNQGDRLLFVFPVLLVAREILRNGQAPGYRLVWCLIMGLFGLVLHWGFWLFVLPKNMGIISEKFCNLFAWRLMSLGDVAYWGIMVSFSVWVWNRWRKGEDNDQRPRVSIRSQHE